MTSQPGVGKTTMVQRLLAMLKAEDGEGGVDVAGFYTEEMRDEKGQRCGFDVVRVGGGPPGAPPRSALARIGQEQPRVGKYSVDVTAFEAFALPALEAGRPKPASLPENPRLYTPLDGTPDVVGLLEECGEEEGATCRVFVPSTGQELSVEASQLQILPDDWKPPQEEPEAMDDEQCPRLCVCDEVGKMELLSLKFPRIFLEALDGDAIVLGTLPQPARGQRDHEVVEEVKRRQDVRVLQITRNNRDARLLEAYAKLRESLGLGPPGTGQVKPDKRKAKELAEREQREAKEREERDKAEAKERERVAKKERQAAREKERDAKAKQLAKKRELLAKCIRERRKARALVRQKAREAAKSGVVTAVEDEAGSDSSLELEDDEDAVEDLENVEDVDAPVDVEERRAAVAVAARRVRAAGLVPAPAPAPVVPLVAKPAPRQQARPPLRPPPRPPTRPAPAVGRGRGASKAGGAVVLLDEVL